MIPLSVEEEVVRGVEVGLLCLLSVVRGTR